jgi:hypothetical protein
MQYKAEIVFTSNLTLTPKQVDDLLGHLELQVSEPVDSNQEAEDYATSLISININKEDI